MKYLKWFCFIPAFFSIFLFLKATVGALHQHSTETSDERELEEYKENMAWKAEATKGFREWWDRMQTEVKNPDEKRVSEVKRHCAVETGSQIA